MLIRAPLPPFTELNEHLSYDQDTGVLRWKKPSPRKRRDGTAGFVHHTGYRYIGVGRKSFGAHHIIWKLMTNEEPPTEIDHINGNKDDNRWCNLRSVTRGQNKQNSKTPRDNTSGVKGVSRYFNKWIVYITHNGRRHYLGLFKTLEEAAAARKNAANSLHGEFARHT